MNELNRLRDTLRPHLPWHGARLNFVCLFLMALFQAKTVNLAELATVFGGSRLADSGELLILITNACPETALGDYARRWGLENLFGALKTRGFCLELTHFNDPERLSRLLALLSLAFTWAMKVSL